MDIQDYELPGAFYLGKVFDPEQQRVQDELVMYDSQDLCTHGVVLGMTGSGKTGLCISLIEEALMDSVPSLVIDPKGDITNLALTFPQLSPQEFEPWVNPDEARARNLSIRDFAKEEAERWQKGLAKWGQSPQRIQSLKERGQIRIYTPGSDAGLPVSILSSLQAPPEALRADLELFGDTIGATVSGLLALVGIHADPIQSPEHVFLSQIFQQLWREGKDLTLSTLIRHIHEPPFHQVGVLDLESFFPEEKRAALSLRFNSLLAAPSFAGWLQGEPLDIQRMLFDDEGKPRISVFSIAHLSDSERMFFVSLLLNRTLGWMRQQSGTTSLRALLYMDEIFGFLPPTANPPSKKPLLTLLKQARAFGLGILLATQNPVDLDYKALSNIGTWFLGRLQTERDKARVLEGLLSLAEQKWGRSDWDRILSSLEKRVFVLHNVHAPAPTLFHVRWALSYLAGPLNRQQVRRLVGEHRPSLPSPIASAPKNPVKTGSPLLSKNIHQYFVPVSSSHPSENLVYLPAMLRAAEVHYRAREYQVDAEKEIVEFCRLRERTPHPSWNEAEELPLPKKDLLAKGLDQAKFAPLPAIAFDEKLYKEEAKAFAEEIYRHRPLELFQSPSLGTVSSPNETQVDFRQRLQVLAKEARAERLLTLRAKYEKRVAQLEKKLENAEVRVEREKAEATQSKLSTVISIGTSLLGGLLGGRSRSLGYGATAARGAARTWKQAQDVGRAEEKVERLRKELLGLEEELREEMEEVRASIDPAQERFEHIQIQPFKKDIHVKDVALVWLPYHQLSEYELEPAWAGA